MVIYFIPEVLLFLLSLYSIRLNYLKFKRCLILICFIWICIFGLRSVLVGNDTSNYVSFFLNKSSGMGYGDLNGLSDIEPGLIFITRIIKLISDSYTVWFLIIATWLWIAIYKLYILVTDYKKIAPSLLAIFLVANTFVTLMVAMRQATAICVFLTGLILVIKNNYVDGKIKFNFETKLQLLGILLIFSSVLIHKSMILLIPIVLGVQFLKVTRTKLICFVLISCMISILFSDSIGSLFNLFFVSFGQLGIDFVNSEVMDVYAEDFGGNTQKITTYIAWALPAIVTIRLSDENEVQDLFFKIYVLSVCLFLLLSKTFLIERINSSLMLLGFTRFWPTIATKESKWRVAYLCFLLLLLVNAFVRYNNWPSTDSCIPYYFFWEK